MTDLIARARSMISDPAGVSQQFDDQTIQDVLDESRVNVRQAVLRPAITITNSGTFDYTDYYADTGDWEADAVIQNGSWQTITPATSDFLTGHWTFSLPTPGQVPPLFITGKFYDKYCAAADLLERWAASLARNYDFSGSGQSFRRSQASTALLTQAKQYRKKQRPGVLPMVRSDLSDDTSMMNLTAGNTDVWN